MMRALSVRQPYAWAIAEGGKPVENRTQQWHHRGLLAIHAPRLPHTLGMEDPAVHAAWREVYGEEFVADHGRMLYGAVIGVVDLVAVHVAEDDCCAPWGQHGHRIRHLVLRDPFALPEPVPCKGSQGLWVLDAADETLVREQLSARR